MSFTQWRTPHRKMVVYLLKNKLLWIIKRPSLARKTLCVNATRIEAIAMGNVGSLYHIIGSIISTARVKFFCGIGRTFSLRKRHTCSTFSQNYPWKEKFERKKLVRLFENRRIKSAVWLVSVSTISWVQILDQSRVKSVSGRQSSEFKFRRSVALPPFSNFLFNFLKPPN